MGNKTKQSPKDLAFEKERAKYRQEIRERDSVIKEKMLEIHSLKDEIQSLNVKLSKKEDEISSLRELLALPEGELKKAIESHEAITAVSSLFNDGFSATLKRFM